jgi:hypothetical protein
MDVETSWGVCSLGAWQLGWGPKLLSPWVIKASHLACRGAHPLLSVANQTSPAPPSPSLLGNG